MQVYDEVVTLDATPNAHGRPRKHPQPSVPACDAREAITQLPVARLAQGQLARRLERAAERTFRARAGARGARIAQGRRLPADASCWLICEEHRDGERRYYLSNLPPEISWLELTRTIKGRWVCEQAHQ